MKGEVEGGKELQVLWTIIYISHFRFENILRYNLTVDLI